MMQKLLGRLTSTPESPQVDEALAQLVLGTPAVVRATLVTSTGLTRGSFPRQGGIEADRVAAMSAAIISLGERICNELDSGDLRHAVIAGNKTTQLLIILSKDYALELELRPNVSVDETLGALRESIQSLTRSLVEG